MLIAYPAGGSTDILGRLLADKLRARLGQPVVVENRPGASTAIAMRALEESPADGHTIMLAAPALSAVAATSPELFDPARFVPIAQVSNLLLVLVAHPDFPAANIKDLIAQARANPGKYTFATSTPGGVDHLASELFNQRAGVKIRVIPYKGAASANADLLGGQVDLRWDAMPSSRALIDAGKLKAMAVGDLKRSVLAPDIPAVSEGGIEGFEVPSYYGFIAPPGTPAAPVSRLNQAFGEIIRMPDVASRMKELGLQPMHSTPAAFGQMIKDHTQVWSNVVKTAGIKVE